MAKVIRLETQQLKEARLVTGMFAGNPLAQNELYRYCADYYYEKYRGVFYAPEHVVEDILQNSFIKFWENIECGKIYVENDIVKGKYLEWLHDHPLFADPESEIGRKVRANGFDEEEYIDILYGTGDDIQLDIIADLLPKMSLRCYQILRKFYYEEKKLDRILMEIPSIESKDALKSKKYKCMERLRAVADETYWRYLKYNQFESMKQEFQDRIDDYILT